MNRAWAHRAMLGGAWVLGIGLVLFAGRSEARPDAHGDMGRSTTQPTSSPVGAPLFYGEHLGLWRAKLKDLAAKKRALVRVTVWGDSHIASDIFTGTWRHGLQEKYGDAGHGFVLLGKPWPSYSHQGVQTGADKGWRAERIWSRYTRRHPRPRDDRFGLAGISVHARRKARTWVHTSDQRSWQHLELFFLQQPRGGTLRVLVDGRLIKQIATAGKRTAAGFASIRITPPGREIELVSSGGEVRLYGADLRSGSPGILLDTLGLNGAKAHTVLKWDESLMYKQVEQLAPDLIVVAYGANEVDMKHLTPERFADDFSAMLLRMRRLAPKASCLVLGPPDRARYVKEQHTWEHPENLQFIIEEERRLARDKGCAFWDQQQAMGGAGSIFKWRTATPPLALRDHVHLTVAGYQQLAEALLVALK